MSDHEPCTTCDFVADRWTNADAVGAAAALGAWWRLLVEGADPALLNARPAPATWSPLEYLEHTTVVVAVWRMFLDEVRTGTLAVDEPAPMDASADDQPRTIDADEAIDALDRECTAFWKSGGAYTDETWDRTGRIGERDVSARYAALHVAHDGVHHVRDADAILRAHGLAMAPAVGEVVAVHASDGGVPKRPVAAAEVGWSGVAGDRQHDRLHHGRPFQALCLYSADVIEALRADGHPIEHGSVGENVTVAGVDWAAMRPGARLRLGTVDAEVSLPAVPCAKNAGFFVDGDYRRMAHDRHPGWSRWYAWVRRPGVVGPGDPVVVEGG